MTCRKRREKEEVSNSVRPSPGLGSASVKLKEEPAADTSKNGSGSLLGGYNRTGSELACKPTAARKHQEVTPAAAGTRSEHLHPSSLAQRLQQHSGKSRSRSRHQARLNREEARPTLSHVRRALLPSQQPSFRFLAFVPCALRSPHAEQLQAWTRGLLRTVVQWEHPS